MVLEAFQSNRAFTTADAVDINHEGIGAADLIRVAVINSRTYLPIPRL